MTIQEMFNSIKKCGYVADNKTDGNGAEHGNDGRFVAKGASITIQTVAEAAAGKIIK